ENGFKLFGRGGEKLTVAAERRIEQRFREDVPRAEKPAGRASVRPAAVMEYVDFAVGTLPPGVRLDGLKVVVDCAHGATGVSTPAALVRLGAEVVTTHTEGDGLRINEGCGSLHPEAVREAALRPGGAIGLAHDGDGDRLVMVDELGDVVDGDRVLGLIADRLARLGELNGGRVVGTVLSNRGLERWLEGRGLQFHRSEVGDRNVWQMMKHHDADLGGEPSGHTILRRLLSTDDALLTGLQVLGVMAVTGRPLCELVAPIPLLPRQTLNLEVRRKPALEEVPAVALASAEARRMLHDDGRLVVRYSGTEAVARIQVEGPDTALLSEALELVAGAFRSAGIAA
ncbi:MAG: phosphoglucosamine mutase, partial [Armatimonadetes bacterium]|nr:phosphoglucosamine mutase [Armatimonadota bacterium]